MPILPNKSFFKFFHFSAFASILIIIIVLILINSGKIQHYFSLNQEREKQKELVASLEEKYKEKQKEKEQLLTDKFTKEQLAREGMMKKPEEKLFFPTDETSPTVNLSDKAKTKD